VFPNFLGIGAQKAGTTWLHRNLRVHPQIWMPPIKEIHYFDEKVKSEGGFLSRLRGDRPADVRWRRQARTQLNQFPGRLSPRDLAWDLKYFFGAPGDGWYSSLFEPGQGKVTGEMTPDYAILEKDAISRIHEIMPRAKIIFMMRNPIERPWSVTDMGLRIRGESIEEIPDRKLYRRLDAGRVRLRTDYLRTLRNWGTFYPEEQIFAGFLEDIYFFPEETLRRLYRFLGVDPSVASRAIRHKVHPGSVSTMPAKFAVYLARSHREEIKQLEERFGGYASFWRFCAERLIEDPPKKKRQLTYPLWESRLWKQWEGSGGMSPQSGPLSSSRAAS
jgi:Sulfotransferase family